MRRQSDFFCQKILHGITYLLLMGFLFSPIFAESLSISDSSGIGNTFHPRERESYYPYFDDGTPWKKTSDVKLKRLSVVVGGFLIFDAFGYAKISDLQYNTQTTTFHLHEGSRDIREYKQIDKVGHLVESYYISRLSSKIYRWGGFSAPTSIWLGSLTGFIWMLQIEITDGFYKAWGFSYYDLTCNIIGCSLAALQQFHPDLLKAFRFKVSYYPSPPYKRGEYSSVSKSWLDDYEGFNFWFAMNVYDVLPERWKNSYPPWLSPWGICLGYGVQGIANDVFNGRREIILGLDFDLNKIPTGQNNFLKFWKDEFNYIRLPLPAVRLTPHTVWFGLYFAK